MNIYEIALWVYYLAGMGVLLTIAFRICYEQVKKAPQSSKKHTHEA